MAPAACDTIYQNLMDFNRQPGDYDQIITGDLGTIGQRILIDLLREKGFDLSGCHMDCGIEIYDAGRQDTHAGGSGCGCAAVTLAAMILPRMRKGIWKRVLFVPTGALLSKVSFNEGQPIPGIAHGIILERC
jgi:stage V sporulation protein AD